MLPKRLTNDDRAAVALHYAALDEQDLRLRFGYLPQASAISDYVQRLDFERDALYGMFDAELQLVAVSHLAVSHDPGVAEFGVSVLKPHRCQGLGQVLMERSMEHAANSGVHTFDIQTLAHNKPMLKLMLRHTSDIEADGIERLVHLHPAAGGVVSHLHERALDEMASAEYLTALRLRDARQLWRGLRHYRHSGALPQASIPATNATPLEQAGP